MPHGIFELALIITLATILGFITRIFKQPLLVAYLATGAILGYFSTIDLHSNETFQLFADLGIMFLLFLVGLEINYNSLRLVGKASIIVGLGQIILAALSGFFIAHGLGFDLMPAAYIAVALTFSSTIIIVKLLSDKKDTHSLYGKISIGLLLVQDAVAILLLIVLGSMRESSQGVMIPEILMAVAKAILLFVVVLWLGRKILPYIFDKIAHSQELLFLSSTAWVLILVTIVGRLGFSIEIAGFLAGLALANSSEHFQIAAKIRPLRDFFVLIFFIILGASFATSDFSGIGKPIWVLSVFVLLGNPLIVLLIMGLMGYRKRTSFMTGVTVAQVSEFSLIVAALGLKLGHIDSKTVSVITAVGIITITLSTYMIVYAHQIFTALSGFLSLFEKKKVSEKHLPDGKFKKKILLIGFHRTGRGLVPNLNKEDLLIIDFDPEAILAAERQGYDYILGDITDEDVFDKAYSSKTKLIISTSPDINDNRMLLQQLKRLGVKCKLIMRAETERDAEILYATGAHYVILPNLSAGHYLGRALTADFKLNVLAKLKSRDMEILKHHKP